MKEKRVANVLEKQDHRKKSTLTKRGIFTLKDWCTKNGYNGVTRECVMSAMQNNDPKVNKMAKKAVLTRVAKTK